MKTSILNVGVSRKRITPPLGTPLYGYPVHRPAQAVGDDLDVIAAALKNVYDRRDSIKHGVKIVWETELMRHFTVKLARIED